MFFEQAIAHQIPGYTKESDSAYGETLAPLDYKRELKVTAVETYDKMKDIVADTYDKVVEKTIDAVGNSLLL